MRSYPTDTYDTAEAEQLRAAPWMLEQLKLNPSYVHWGPYEDYMWKPGADEPNGRHGWDTRILINSWSEFDLSLDELNEVVHFYFEINRAHEDCDVCAGNGYHPDAQWVTESFYEHSSPFKLGNRELMRGFAATFQRTEFKEVHGPNSFPDEETFSKYGPEFRAFCEAMRKGDGYWQNKITDDEAKALHDAFRTEGTKWNAELKTRVPVREYTAAEINRGVGLGPGGHDGINRCILIDTRLARLGVPKSCPKCEGQGYVYTEPEGHLGLVLWLLHPRKGSSRGVHVKDIQQEQLPAVYAYLRNAADRNAQRFSKIPGGVS